jgi:hydrogenase/urease accessory protein HupE
MGQPLLCECGVFKLFEPAVMSVGNSQQLADWYSPSHVIHGLIFYALLTWAWPRSSVMTRLLLAVGVEVAWEVVENTPIVIEHYRLQALASGYTGDSVLNSISDTFMMMLGFAFARLAPWWASVVLALGLEAVSLVAIRDSLVLNITGFFYRFDFVSRWQQGG